MREYRADDIYGLVDNRIIPKGLVSKIPNDVQKEFKSTFGKGLIRILGVLHSDKLLGFDRLSLKAVRDVILPLSNHLFPICGLCPLFSGQIKERQALVILGRERVVGQP